MKKTLNWLIVILIIVIAGAAMTVTCPDAQAHKEKLAQMVGTSVKEAIGGNSDDGDLLSQGLQLVGGVVIDKVVDSTIDNMLQVDNYVVCSIGRVNYSGEDNIVSVGLLGHIFTANQDRLNEATKKYYTQWRQEAIGSVGDKVRESLDSYAGKVVEGFVGAMGNVIRDMFSGSAPEEDDQSSR